MPNYRRPFAPGATIFFTVCLAVRRSDLLTREISSLRMAVQRTRKERPFGIDAWVVLPDHMHCIWTLPEGDADFSVRWGAIKARFSRSLGRAGFTPPSPIGVANGGVNPALRRKGEVGLWQPRFWEHHIRGPEDYAAHIRYCWLNPVKHGLVDVPEDWQFSSFYVAAQRDGRERRGEPRPTE